MEIERTRNYIKKTRIPKSNWDILHADITNVLRVSTQVEFFKYVKEQLDATHTMCVEDEVSLLKYRDSKLLPSSITAKDAILLYLHWLVHGNSERECFGKNTIHCIFVSIEHHAHCKVRPNNTLSTNCSLPRFLSVNVTFSL